MAFRTQNTKRPHASNVSNVKKKKKMVEGYCSTILFFYLVFNYIFSSLSYLVLHSSSILSFFSTSLPFSLISLTVIPLSLSTSCHAVDTADLTLWFSGWFWSFFFFFFFFLWFWVNLILGFLGWWFQCVFSGLGQWWLVDFRLFLR